MGYVVDEYWKDADGIQRIKDDDTFLYGLLDKSGNMIVPCKYRLIIGFDKNVRLSAVWDYNGKWGYINAHGQEILSCEYEQVDDYFYCGRARVKKNGKYGYVNGCGKIEIGCDYDDASIFWDDMASVKENGKWGIITLSGQIKFPLVYELIDVLGEGIIVAGKKTKLNVIKYCMYDYSAHRLTGFDYDAIGDRVLSDGRILYKKGSEKGFLDKQGVEHKTLG